MTFFAHPLDDHATLTLVSVEDAAALTELIRANQTRLAQWEDWAQGPQEVEEKREFLRGKLRAFVEGTSVPCFLRVDGALVGSVELRLERNRNAEIGYWIDAKYEGRGLVRRACEALIDHAFGALGLERLELYIIAENERSRGLAQRLGFTDDGTRRSAMVVGDRRFDVVTYGLLRGEWRR